MKFTDEDTAEAKRLETTHFRYHGRHEARRRARDTVIGRKLLRELQYAISINSWVPVAGVIKELVTLAYPDPEEVEDGRQADT